MNDSCPSYSKGLKLFHLDVKMMFLSEDLLEEVYMNHPQGFVVFRKGRNVC